jgi:XTP/dITP diphosphohydrolase
VNVPARVVLASRNPGKLSELSALLAPAGLAVGSLAEWGVESPEEPAETFLENALLKARHASAATGLPALADDSGLLVPALGGAPGVRSARYAGEGASDLENLQRLLVELAARPGASRDARFVCVMAAVRSPEDPDPLVARGVWPGRIASAPRGRGGFGYDPIFELPELGLCSAELSAAEKHERSHRGQACRALLERIAAEGWPGG